MVELTLIIWKLELPCSSHSEVTPLELIPKMQSHWTRDRTGQPTTGDQAAGKSIMFPRTY